MRTRGFSSWIPLLFWLSGGAAFTQPAEVRDEIHLATVNSNYRKALELIARQYEALHPTTHVRISIITNEYSPWLRTQFAGGEHLAPDIYNGNYTAEYIGMGRWEPLNDALAAINPYTGTPWIDTLNRKLVEHFYFGDVAYYIPLDYIDVAFVYNRSMFDQLGLTPPGTWAELIQACRVVRERGPTVEVRGKSGEEIIPMAMSGNAQDFWEGPVGWLTRILADGYHRSEVARVKTQPGDWNYIPARDATFSTDFSDPYNDVNTTLSHERLLRAFGDGTLRVDTPKFRAIYSRIAELSTFWPQGFEGINFGSSEALFVKQKAAMLFTTSHFVTHSNRILRDLKPEDRFEWGAFSVPSITDDPLCESPTLRGIANAGANYVVTRKSDRAHVRRVIDFLMFLTRPESGQMLFDETLKDDQFIVGPIQIQGVKLPPALEANYRPFLGRGFEKLDFRGTVVEYEWTLLTQEFLGGRMSLDRYLREHQKLLALRIEREIRRFHLDLDPSTNDELRKSETVARKSLLNPLENGILLVGLLAVGYGAFTGFLYSRARGLRRPQAALAYFLLIPTMLGLICFIAFPAISGLYRGFTEWVEGSFGRFCGLRNFQRLLGDFLVWRAALNMVILTAANLVKATVIPFAVAELLMAIRHPKVRYLFRTLFLTPMVVPGVTMILIWGFIYDPNVGMLNQLLNAAGLKGVSWFGEPWVALPSIIGMGFPWIGAFSLLIYIGGLLQISESVRDAAVIDCRSGLQRVWLIDVPLVRRQTKFIVILTLIGSLQDFQTVLLMTNGGPGLATSVPALQMYQRAFKFGEYGYASAIGFGLFLLILLITLINLKALRTEARE